MDINLLELSLQNHHATNITTETDQEEQEMRRLESFSPELEKLNEQNFKIKSDRK
jgi:hypothetical protein